MGTNKKKKIVINTNAWMATYTDLMILLLTFFVLLLSLSTVDKRRKRLALNSLVGAFGFKPGGQSILGQPKGLNITIGSAPLAREEIQFEQLRNIALKHGMESDMEMDKQLERTVITLSNKVLFDLGTDRINQDSKEFLSELTGVLKDGPMRIELRGYTDSTEIVLKSQPLRHAMRLSSKRAMAIFDFFKKGGISARAMVAHGFGMNPERSKNAKEKSWINRQVVIILDYEAKVPYRMKKPLRTGSFLDFKGFFFGKSLDKNE